MRWVVAKGAPVFRYAKDSNLPVRLTLVAVLVLIITTWNLLRLYAAIAWFPALEHYAPYPGPVYTAITGGVFALLGLGILVSGWRRQAWTPRLTLLAAWMYTGWAWADRLFVRSQVLTGRVLDAILAAALLGLVTAVALDRRNAAYFRREANERTVKD
jgi:hypothetical protein